VNQFEWVGERLYPTAVSHGSEHSKGCSQEAKSAIKRAQAACAIDC